MEQDEIRLDETKNVLIVNEDLKTQIKEYAESEIMPI